MYIPKIDYSYWLNKAKAKKDINKNIITALTNKGFIPDGSLLHNMIFDEEGHRKDMSSIWKSAQDLAKDLDLDIDKDKMLLIFDAIQVWGGKMGRSPYKKSGRGKNADLISREKWYENGYDKLYLQGAKLSREGKYVEALKVFNEIPGLSTNFSTKHLGFWGNAPILDTRIARLLYGKMADAEMYGEYIEGLGKVASQVGAKDAFEVEQALFSFSQNYFDNPLTKITWKEGDDDTDKEEAENILSMRGSDVKTPSNSKWKHINQAKNKVIIPKAISKTIGGDLYITALGLQKSPELQNLKVDTSNKTDYPNMGMMYKVVDVNAEREK
jgi:hypothetical protein